jgi:hypothetical protein
VKAPTPVAIDCNDFAGSNHESVTDRDLGDRYVYGPVLRTPMRQARRTINEQAMTGTVANVQATPAKLDRATRCAMTPAANPAIATINNDHRRTRSDSIRDVDPIAC